MLAVVVAMGTATVGAVVVNGAGGGLELHEETESVSRQSNGLGARLSISTDPEGSTEQANTAGARIVPVHVLPTQVEPLDADVWLIR